MSVTTSTVYLKKVATGERVAAELRDGIELAQLTSWQTQWLPARQRYLDTLKAAQAPASAFPQSLHWDWSKKAQEMQNLLALQGFCVVCEGVLQGLMRIDVAGERCKLPIQTRQDMVYVDYLEVAPWNWGGPYFDTPRFRRVGSILLRAAMEVSVAEAFKGRIGLHSLPQSVAYYARCGLTDCGLDANYPGPVPLPYFEATPEQAQAFLTRGS